MIQYILKTLQNEDYVFIERLGSFRVRLRHATIEDGVVHPPYNEVVFSQDDSEENNFALANQISREQQCLFTEANEQVTAWVSELLTALQHNKSVTYEDFGTFMLDKKGNLSFESAIVPQLNSLFEGMEPVDIKQFGISVPVAEPEPVVESEPEETMKDDELVAEPEPIVEPEPVIESEPIVEQEPEETMKGDETMRDDELVAEQEPIAEPEPVIEPEPVVEPEPEETMKDDEDDDEDDDDDEEEEEDDDDDHKKRHSLAWVWVILLILIVLGVLGFVFKDKLMGYYQQWKDRKQSMEQVVTADDNADATATVDEITDPEPVGANSDSPEETVTEEESVAEPEPAPKTYTPAAVKQSADGKYDYIRFEKGHYYVIAGSFPSEQDVIRHIRQKKLDQYSPKILKQDGVSNLRVCIGVFDTESEAESFAKGVNSQYWVLK